MRKEATAGFSVASNPSGQRWDSGVLDRVNLDIEERKQAEFYLAEGQRLTHMASWAFTLLDSTTGLQSYSGFMGLIRAARPQQ